MTNTQGRVFISYSRKCLGDVAGIVQCLADHGIPAWQDINDLSHTQTEDEIRRVLGDQNTAGALMYIAPEVSASDMIKNVEAPEIINRAVADRNFLLVPVAAGGLDYKGVGPIFQGYIGANDLSTWNILKVNPTPLTQDDAVVIAKRLLRERVRAIHGQLPAGDTIAIQFALRQILTHTGDYTLTIDWFKHFNGRFADVCVWSGELLPALKEIISAVEQEAPGRRIEASGNPTLSAALALGVECLSTRNINLAWKQLTAGQPAAKWSLSNNREPCGLSARTTSLNVCANDLALLLSVTGNVEADFSRTQNSLPQLRACVNVGDFQQGGLVRRQNLTGGEAIDAAHIIINAIRDARDYYNARGTVHIFMAVPAGLAMMVGQLLNTFGEIVTYEHVPGGTPPYVQGVVLHP